MTLMYHIVLLRHQAEKAGIPFLPTSPFRGNREQDEQIELPLRATDDSSARFEANTIATQYHRHFPPLFEKIVFSILTTKNIQNFQMEGFHVQDDWLFV